MMAQRYPTQYNGILATASAFNWDKFIASEYWPQVVMHSLGELIIPQVMRIGLIYGRLLSSHM